MAMKVKTIALVANTTSRLDGRQNLERLVNNMAIAKADDCNMKRRPSGVDLHEENA